MAERHTDNAMTDGSLNASAVLIVPVILAKALRQNMLSFWNAHMRVAVILAKTPYQGKLLILIEWHQVSLCSIGPRHEHAPP